MAAEQSCLLVEILSCKNLLIRDRKAKSSDPYIKVKLGTSDLHQTKAATKTLNPTFGEQHNNVFVLGISKQEVFDKGGLIFKGKDRNLIKTDQDLGQVLVPAAELFEASGQVMDFKFEAPSDATPEEKSNAGSIQIRTIPATEADLKKYGKKGLRGFVDKIHSQAKSQVLDIKEHIPSPKMLSAVSNPSKTSVVGTNKLDESAKEDADADNGKLNLLLELVAARNLLVADKNTASSDPYCKVYFGDKEIHKTKYLTQTLNPVFHPGLKSAFILKCTPEELEDKKGLKFEMKDWDRVGANDYLGHFQVEKLDYSGAVMEFKIIPPTDRVGQEAGSALIRCRKATARDEELLQKGARTNLFPTTTKEASAVFWGMQTTAAESGADEVIENAGISAVKTDFHPELGEELHLSIEIVSCRNLISRDKNGLSDPYVKIIMGGTELHKTKYVRKTLDPDFGEGHHNVYAFHCYATDLFEIGGLTLKVKDFDRILANDDLGTTLVPAMDLYDSSKGQSREYKLNPPEGYEGRDAGSVIVKTTFTEPELSSGGKKALLKFPDLVSKSEQKLLSKEALFIEIVSCENLIAADKGGTSDPYVKVKLGKNAIHETKHVMKTLHPCFSFRENSIFIMEESKNEVIANGGLVFKIKDWDRIGKNSTLGEVVVDADTLYDSKGDNMNLKINPPKGSSDDGGIITIRCRPATEKDREMCSRGFPKSLEKGFAPSTMEFGNLDLSLLVEVVSCWNLPSADLDVSDPYVKLSLGPRAIHKTKSIKNTENPIFTIEEDSVFILDVATKEIEERQGITVTVKDFDIIGANDSLGSVVVPSDIVLKASGERHEFALKKDGKDAGFIALRFRPATSYDREFLLSVGGSSTDFMGIRESTRKAMDPTSLLNGVFGGVFEEIKGAVKSTFTTYEKEENGVKKYRIRPYPDPDREKATQFMSAAQIERETFSDSKKWLDIGSGNLGKVFIEILGCDGLPDKDMGISKKDKTDAFVAIVYEDCVAKTDVVVDCLSPRWMPWMQRAFIFRRMHTSSNLNIGVFDFDAGITSGNHDMCGRVSVDLSNFQPDTEYVLRYNIYEDSVSLDRKPQGVLSLRLRMELVSEKELVLSNFQLPPDIYVNVTKGKDFDMIRKTVGGKKDLSGYSTSTIGLYAEELMSYGKYKYVIMDGVKTLLLWRGQMKVFGVLLPVHSMYIFVSAITLAERPQLYPSFFFFTIAWVLWGMQILRKNEANPWNRTKTFVGLLTALLIGRPISGPPRTVTAHENEEEAMEQEKARAERIAMAIRESEEAKKMREDFLGEHEGMVVEADEQTADTNIATKTGGRMISLDPLKMVLYPVQIILGQVCITLRYIKNVVSWDEPYVAFLFTGACTAIGVVFLFVPWFFLFRWTSRIISWLVFGPHMKLVDMFYFRHMSELPLEERRKQLEEIFKNELKTAQAYAAAARLQREETRKVKVVKQTMYGKFITKVPVFCVERYHDTPLFESTAKPYQPRHLPKPERIAGQHLVGTMIPRIMDVVDKHEEGPATEQATERTPLLGTA